MASAVPCLWISAALAAGALSCGGNTDTDGGLPTLDAPTIERFEIEAAATTMAITASWEASGAIHCALDGLALEAGLDELAPVGERLIDVDTSVAGGVVQALLTCRGEGGDAEASATLLMPWLSEIEATRIEERDPEADFVRVCWVLLGAEDPLTCAIHAEGTDEYYYPLEAEGCRDLLVAEQTTAYLVYCTAANGYAERRVAALEEG